MISAVSIYDEAAIEAAVAVTLQLVTHSTSAEQILQVDTVQLLLTYSPVITQMNLLTGIDLRNGK
jgi:hypothetical protein